MIENRILIPHDSDLEERIISMSYKIEQKKPLIKMLYAVFSEFHIYKPQYFLAFFFVIGIILGTFFQTSSVKNNDIMDDFYITGEML